MHGKNAAGMAKLKATVWQREMCVVIETVNEKFKTWQPITSGFLTGISPSKMAGGITPEWEKSAKRRA